MFEDRISTARSIMRTRGVDALLIGPSADLRYLTGYEALPLERLTMLAVTGSGEQRLLVPELEAQRARDSGAGDHVDLVAWAETDDPFSVIAGWLAGAGQSLSLAVQDRLWTAFTLELQARMPQATWVPASTVMRELRMIKTPAEIALLRAAAHAIDAVHAQVPGLLRAGRTERDVARDIAELILEDHDRVNFVIVASGPNGASPHHESGERIIRRGDAVVVDIGGTRQGYCSDVTRNYTIGPAADDYLEMHRQLERAHRAALDAIRPGVAAGAVDEAARAVLRRAALDGRFIHRLGHGIGIEEHEEPWIVAGSTQPLREGMAFSVEPGVYVPSWAGARIEDIVVVTSDGVDILNEQPRKLLECDA